MFVQKNRCFKQKLATEILKVVEKSNFWAIFGHFCPDQIFLLKFPKQFDKEP